MPLTTEDLDKAQRHMAEDIARAARAFGLQFTDREMVFIECLACEVLQQKYEHPSLYHEDIVCLAASKMAACA